MLSRAKASYLAAAAALVILSGVTVSSNTASAQSGIQPAQVEKRDAQDNRRSESRREQRRDASREGRSTRSREITTTGQSDRTVVRRDSDRRHVVVRDRDRRRVIVRSRPSTSVAFVVLGPRVVYRAYGAGWCRGLHRGRHWDRRIGWHAGRHWGPFRC
ncbi:MAG TPA: hypothetical protein VFK79_12210 [Xanthobacteraceae bacterium]|nr:hypothetical protein [Xanthobacteraceae bacterium]